jgi:hypothetical protein
MRVTYTFDSQQKVSEFIFEISQFKQSEAYTNLGMYFELSKSTPRTVVLILGNKLDKKTEKVTETDDLSAVQIRTFNNLKAVIDNIAKSVRDKGKGGEGGTVPFTTRVGPRPPKPSLRAAAKPEEEVGARSR